MVSCIGIHEKGGKMKWHGVALLFVLALWSFRSAAQEDVKRMQKEVEEMLNQDWVTVQLDSVDNAEVNLLSPKHYRAIRAIEAYRESSQREALSPEEKDIMNYNFHITGSNVMTKEEWLTESEKKSCYAIYLYPRGRRGQKVTLHRSGSGMRIAKYAIRKDNYAVVRAVLVEDHPH